MSQWILIALCTTWLQLPAANSPVASQNSATIVMFGDSTTAERPGAVTSVYARRVQKQLQTDGMNATVHNAGVPGNTTANARMRIADILAFRPQIVVIQFGINDSAIDVWAKPPATQPRISISDFEKNLRYIIDELRKQNIETILMTTNPLRWTPKLKELYGRPPYKIDEVDGFDTPVLARYNEVVRKLSAELKVPLVDIHAAFSRGKPDQLLLDGMHPNDEGHELIARSLLPIIQQMLKSQAGPQSR